MNTPDTEIENLENELYAENFNLVQNEYARFLDIVTKHFTKLRSSRDTYWKERVRKEVKFARSNYDREGKHALDYILSRLDNLK